jgi:hypothetical protein
VLIGVSPSARLPPQGEDVDKSQLLNLLIGREPEAIIRTLAMMAYNPAIGRVLERGGVERFADLMTDTVPRYYGSVDRERFDSLHRETCRRILTSFKTARGQKLSYGQAQKPLNVFLKVYVDWAKQPSQELAEKLAPLLHVPLDSLLMKFIKREFREEYETRIVQLRRQLLDRTTERLKNVSSPRTMARLLLGNEFSLTAINREIYLAWQEFFRSLYPAKPVMLDIIWGLERMKTRNENTS